MMNIQDQIACSTTRRSLIGQFWSVNAALGASVIATRRSSTVNALASAAIACSFLLTTYASASPTLEEANPQRAAQVYDICRTVMGYTPIDVEYRACVDSLKQSIAGADESNLVQRDRQACAQAGNAQGTPAFALCVFDRDQKLGQPQ
jgi:hypothetical protein